MTYCVIPRELGPSLHESLRKYFRDDSSVEVVVEQRASERRREERRVGGEAASSADRRSIRAVDGRRVADRRAPAVSVETFVLPRRARPHAARLIFVERLEPSDEQIEDRDTARLVMRIQGGDHDAFANLYMRYFDRVYGYLRIALNNPDEAEDATQQVFMRVLEALPRYERRGAQPFRAWLFVVVRNHAVTRLRQLNRLEATEPRELERRRVEDFEADEQELATLSWISDRELLMFVERLPVAQRQVLLLRYMLGLPYKEIAQILRRSQTDVTMLHSRALRFLRARLAALGRGPRQPCERSRIVRVPQKAHVLRRRRFALRA